MKVTQHTLDEVGWHGIVDAVTEHCLSEPGRASVRGFRFDGSSDPGPTLELVSELMALIDRDGLLPIDGLEDVSDTLELCRRGGCAPAEDLFLLAKTARCLTRTRRRALYHAEEYPALGARGGAIPDVAEVDGALRGLFDPMGAIRDDASPEMQEACQRRAALLQRLKVRLDKYLLREDVADLAQDLYYTQREDRFVIPVIASFQSKLPGIIHGTSNSGETVFIEPEGFVNANNDLKLAEAEVRLQTLEVLRNASADVGREADAMLEGVRQAAALDGVQARARFGLSWDGTVASYGQGRQLRLVDAANPLLLLRGVQVVRNTIQLEEDARFIVVTGPNTGGKTVTLSTVGLQVLMTHAGIPIPAAEGSAVPRFDELFALIGDAQDIQRDLSTFSGHLRALGEVLDAASDGTLALLDELVVGTEPEAGAALAIAVMEALADRGARGFVTTHYPRLKTLAFEDTRFGNASVGVESETLTPSFVLHMGSSGASNPLAIAEQLGFEAGIVARARAIAAGDADLAMALERLEAERAALEEARDEAVRAQNDADTQSERLKTRIAALEARREETERTMHAEVRAAADEALDAIRAQVRDVQGSRDPRLLEERRRELVALRDEAADRAAGDDVEKEERAPGDLGDLEQPPSPGQTVWARPLGKSAQVIEVRDDTVVVAVGGFHTALPVGELGTAALPSAGSPGGKRGPAAEARRPNALPVPQSAENAIDLRGARRDEVEGPLLDFLDQAFRAGQRNVWVIHGVGTGALREEARGILSRVDYVESFRPGDRHEGGDGATIAWLADRS